MQQYCQATIRSYVSQSSPVLYQQLLIRSICCSAVVCESTRLGMGTKRIMTNTICIALLLTYMFLLAAPVEGVAATATFYGGNDASGTNTGACGYPNVLAMGYGTMNTAMSAPLFNGGKACGACFQISCSWVPYGSLRCLPGKIVVTGTNYCPQGSKGGWCDSPRSHFDLAQPAFLQIAPYKAGVVHVEYERVKCQRSGGVRYWIYGRTYFMQVLLYNVGGAGDVTAVSVRGSSSGRWITMYRSWGQLWSTGVVLENQALSFAVTISDGQTVTDNNVVSSSWWYGQTFEGKKQFS